MNNRSNDDSENFSMPCIGLGTWQAPKGVVGTALKEAVRAGYRLIDCAAAYGNEKEIGDALYELLQSNEVQREDLFIVSKVFNNYHVYDGEDRPRESLLNTLKDLQVEYLDLWLMHWPLSFADKQLPEWIRDEKGTPHPDLKILEEYLDTWKCMEQLQREGLVKNIGVSNFRKDQIEKILEAGFTTPLVNQLELHPYLQQPELVQFCNNVGIKLMAYSPLGSKESYSGSTCPPDIGTTLMENPVLLDIARRHGKSVAQILIRWSIHRGFVCIPKSANALRIRENFQIHDWALDERDLADISSLDREFRYCIGYIPGHFDCPNAPWCKKEIQ